MTLWKHHTLNKRRVENLPKSLLASANPRVRLSSRVIRNAYHTAYSRSTAPVASYQFTTSAGIIRRLQKDSCPRLHTHTHVSKFRVPIFGGETITEAVCIPVRTDTDRGQSTPQAHDDTKVLLGWAGEIHQAEMSILKQRRGQCSDNKRAIMGFRRGGWTLCLMETRL